MDRLNSGFSKSSKARSLSKRSEASNNPRLAKLELNSFHTAQQLSTKLCVPQTQALVSTRRTDINRGQTPEKQARVDPEPVLIETPGTESSGTSGIMNQALFDALCENMRTPSSSIFDGYPDEGTDGTTEDVILAERCEEPRREYDSRTQATSQHRGSQILPHRVMLSSL